MRERLRYVNGRLDIESGPHGTTLTAIVPLDVEAMSS
jgi:signal transduction histidine kinase